MVTHTTIISYYSPTNISDEIETGDFYTDLTVITRQVPKHNLLLIAGNYNAHLGQYDGFKYSFYDTTTRNGIMLNNFLHENKSIFLNT